MMVGGVAMETIRKGIRCKGIQKVCLEHAGSVGKQEPTGQEDEGDLVGRVMREGLTNCTLLQFSEEQSLGSGGETDLGIRQ